MDRCIKCGILSRIKQGKSDVYVSASESYLLHKLKGILTKNNQTFSDNNDVLCIGEVSFLDIVVLLFKDTSLLDMEKEQIQALPLLSGETLNPQHLFSFRTLKAWHELVSSYDLMGVIENRRLTTYFQPIFSAQDKGLFAFECLSRGFAEDGRLIPPIELFEKARLLGMQFALDKVTREVSIENAANNRINDYKVFINFLPTAIYNPQDCLQSTTKTAEIFGIRPSNLVFEVVESEQIKDVPHLRSILDYYKSKGFQSALDDFGSGYSSLKMLDELSPDYVKVDIHFIRDIDSNNFKQSVVQAIVSLAQEKGIKTLAEGIETQGEYATVRNLGVDLVQGYLFGRPSPKVSEWLS